MSQSKSFLKCLLDSQSISHKRLTNLISLLIILFKPLTFLVKKLKRTKLLPNEILSLS